MHLFLYFPETCPTHRGGHVTQHVQPTGAVTLRNIGDPHSVGVPRRVYSAYVASRAQQRLAGVISSTRIDATTARGVSPHPPVKPYSHTILCVSRAPERSPSARASLSCHVPRAAAARARAASSTCAPVSLSERFRDRQALFKDKK